MTTQSREPVYLICNDLVVSELTCAKASSSLEKSPEVSPAMSFSRSFLNTVETGVVQIISQLYLVPLNAQGRYQTQSTKKGPPLTFFVDAFNFQQLLVIAGAHHLD